MKIGSAINETYARNIYPSLMGGTSGQRSMPTSDYSGGGMNGAAPAVAGNGVDEQVSYSAQVGSAIGAAPAWLVLATMAILYMWWSSRVSTDNIKPTVLNILTISWIAAIGIVFFKTLFTRFPVPGITSVFQAV